MYTVQFIITMYSTLQSISQKMYCKSKRCTVHLSNVSYITAMYNTPQQCTVNQSNVQYITAMCSTSQQNTVHHNNVPGTGRKCLSRMIFLYMYLPLTVRLVHLEKYKGCALYQIKYTSIQNCTYLNNNNS